MRLLVAALALCGASGLDNGVGQLPMMGWTVGPIAGEVWEGNEFNVSAAMMTRAADWLVDGGLRDVGFEYVMLDAGWSNCSEPHWCTHRTPAGFCGVCEIPSPRLDGGAILVDPRKFPPSAPGANDGIKLVADYIHSKGLKLSLYTAPHGQGCGGYWGSLGHERTDALLFASWGIDAVKSDMGCQDDASIHDGTLLGSLQRFRDGLNASGRPVLFYVDGGNPTATARVANPFGRGVPDDLFTRTHVATELAEAPWAWAPATCHSYKFWFDRHDTFASLMDNVEAQVLAGLPWFQRRGAIANPDALTVGRGALPGGRPGMTAGQYRIEVFLYAMLSAPLVLCCDLSSFATAPQQANARALLLNAELIAIDQDRDAVMASRIGHAGGRNPWATDLWVKPLSDGSFAVAMINKDTGSNHTVSVRLSGDTDGDFYAGPTNTTTASVRDVFAQRELGRFTGAFSATVPPMDGAIFRVTFVS